MCDCSGGGGGAVGLKLELNIFFLFPFTQALSHVLGFLIGFPPLIQS